MTVFLDIDLTDQNTNITSRLGRLVIEIYDDLFPFGSKNFVELCTGSNGISYVNCKFYKIEFSKYAMCGDITNNNGTGAATIFNNEPILGLFGETYISHSQKGLISLVPFKSNGINYYDSNFMITLISELRELDNDCVVIGKVVSGIEILNIVNNSYRSFPGKKYPIITIANCGLFSRGMLN